MSQGRDANVWGCWKSNVNSWAEWTQQEGHQSPELPPVGLEA